MSCVSWVASVLSFHNVIKHTALRHSLILVVQYDKYVAGRHLQLGLWYHNYFFFLTQNNWHSPFSAHSAVFQQIITWLICVDEVSRASQPDICQTRSGKLKCNEWVGPCLFNALIKQELLNKRSACHFTSRQRYPAVSVIWLKETMDYASSFFLCWMFH